MEHTGGKDSTSRSDRFSYYLCAHHSVSTDFVKISTADRMIFYFKISSHKSNISQRWLEALSCNNKQDILLLYNVFSRLPLNFIVFLFC